MNDKAKKYLVDIIQDAELIEVFMAEVESFADYQNDLKTMSAVERQLGIIGEAVNQYEKEKTGARSLSHARKIVDFRNRLIHAYDSMDDTVVWAIIKGHLPILYAEAQAFLSEA